MRRGATHGSPAMNGPDKPPKNGADLDELGDRLARSRERAGLVPPAPPRRGGSELGEGLRIAVEFVVSVFVGTGLGYVIGGFLGSAVIGLLIGLLFGFAAGLRGVYRGMMAGSGSPSEETDDDGA
jgi:ATP synthase protein I